MEYRGRNDEFQLFSKSQETSNQDSGFCSSFSDTNSDFYNNPEDGSLSTSDNVNTTETSSSMEEENSSKIQPYTDIGYNIQEKLAQISISDNNQQPPAKVDVSCISKAFTPDEDGDTYLHRCLLWNEQQTAIKLIQLAPNPIYLDTQNREYRQAGIHIAAYLNQAQVVYELITKNANIDVIDYNGNNILHLCAERGHDETLIAIVLALKKINRVQLIQSIINELNFEGFTPFYVAVSKKNTKICEALASLNADVTIPDSKNGNSPLHEAIIPQETDPVFIQFLLKNCDVDVNHQNYAGVTPLHIAASKNDKVLCSLLLIHKADISVVDVCGRLPVNFTDDPEIIKHLHS